MKEKGKSKLVFFPLVWWNQLRKKWDKGEQMGKKETWVFVKGSYLLNFEVKQRNIKYSKLIFRSII